MRAHIGVDAESGLVQLTLTLSRPLRRRHGMGRVVAGGSRGDLGAGYLRPLLAGMAVVQSPGGGARRAGVGERKADSEG